MADYSEPDRGVMDDYNPMTGGRIGSIDREKNTRPTGPIGEKLNDIFELASSLEGCFDRLVDRVDPVLTPKRLTDASDKLGMLDPSSEGDLMRRLRALEEKLLTFRAGINEVVDRVEL